MITRYAYGLGWLLLAFFLVLLVANAIRNPVQAKRQEFERRLADQTVPDFKAEFATNPQFEAWENSVTSRPKLWGPLIAAPQAVAAPPALQQMLAGVEPTRNKLGSGPSQRIQIIVDGKKGWYSKGDPIKGCVLEEITDNDVLFTLEQGGRKHGMRVPRK